MEVERVHQPPPPFRISQRLKLRLVVTVPGRTAGR
jgi:hypothetical protein